MSYDGSVGSGALSANTVKHEVKRGSDFSGSSGATNRTITLANVPISSSVIVWVTGKILHKTSEYTVSGSIVTIIGMLRQDDFVDIRYFTVN